MRSRLPALKIQSKSESLSSLSSVKPDWANGKPDRMRRVVTGKGESRKQKAGRGKSEIRTEIRNPKSETNRKRIRKIRNQGGGGKSEI
jgi:hypothetical protein